MYRHRRLLLLPVIFFVLIPLFVISEQPSKNYHFENIKEITPDPLVAKYSPPGVKPPRTTKSVFKILGDIGGGLTSVRVPVLLYHYVEINKDPKDTIRQSLTVSPYWFEQQMKYLIENGYTTITFDDLIGDLKEGNPLPQKPVILTFDDGYRDFYTDVFPILKKYNVKATNFVFPTVLDKPNNMDTWMVKEIVNSGLVTIGSHTLTHPFLPQMSETFLRKEIIQSKQLLEQILGRSVDYFAYPYGAFDEKTIEIVKEGNYKAAIATTQGSKHGIDTLFRISRTRIGNYSSELFQKKLDE